MDTVRIPKARLEELEQKERAHDDYLHAQREVRRRAAAYEISQRQSPANDALWSFTQGYKRAQHDFAEAIVEADLSRHAVVVTPVPSGTPPRV